MQQTPPPPPEKGVLPTVSVIVPSPIWGPGGWAFMESKLRWGEHFTSPIEEDHAYKYLVTMIHHLPGSGCKLKFREHVNELDPPKPGMDRGAWLFRFHNATTKRLNEKREEHDKSPLFTEEMAIANWTPKHIHEMSSETIRKIETYRATVFVTDNYNGLEMSAWTGLNAISNCLVSGGGGKEVRGLFWNRGNVVVAVVVAPPGVLEYYIYNLVQDNVHVFKCNVNNYDEDEGRFSGDVFENGNGFSYNFRTGLASTSSSLLPPTPIPTPTLPFFQIVSQTPKQMIIRHSDCCHGDGGVEITIRHDDRQMKIFHLCEYYLPNLVFYSGGKFHLVTFPMNTIYKTHILIGLAISKLLGQNYDVDCAFISGKF